MKPDERIISVSCKKSGCYACSKYFLGGDNKMHTCECYCHEKYDSDEEGREETARDLIMENSFGGEKESGKS